MNGPTSNLRIALLPLPIKWADKEKNISEVEKALELIPQGTDLVVLPELFSTGFTDDTELLAELAERNTGSTLDTIKKWASKTGAAFAGSFLASTPPKTYNRGFFIEPSGDETFYDKRHLFSLSSEAKVLTAGQTAPLTVRFRGWNIALTVCYDLRFPILCRNTPTNSFDLLLVVANWPKVREYAWEHLLIARAIENQCFVAGANRGGNDRYGSYEDMSYIFDAHGYAVGVKPQSSPFIVADLDGAKLTDYRKAFPVLADADSFTLQ